MEGHTNLGKHAKAQTRYLHTAYIARVKKIAATILFFILLLYDELFIINMPREARTKKASF
jgi:hypothetical protein